MTSRVAARVLLLVVASALIWVGVAFAGYGLLLAFLPALGPAWAAIAAAVVLLIAPLIACISFALHGWRAAPAQSPMPEPHPEQIGLAALAGVAKEKPLLAVLLAGLMGAAGAISQRKFR
jgi:hypothetical protein